MANKIKWYSELQKCVIDGLLAYQTILLPTRGKITLVLSERPNIKFTVNQIGKYFVLKRKNFDKTDFTIRVQITNNTAQITSFTPEQENTPVVNITSYPLNDKYMYNYSAVLAVEILLILEDSFTGGKPIGY